MRGKEPGGILCVDTISSAKEDIKNEEIRPVRAGRRPVQVPEQEAAAGVDDADEEHGVVRGQRGSVSTTFIWCILRNLGIVIL